MITYIIFFGRPNSTNKKHNQSYQQSNAEIKVNQIALFSKCDTPNIVNKTAIVWNSYMHNILYWLAVH